VHGLLADRPPFPNQADLIAMALLLFRLPPMALLGRGVLVRCFASWPCAMALRTGLAHWPFQLAGLSRRTAARPTVWSMPQLWREPVQCQAGAGQRLSPIVLWLHGGK